MSVKVRAVAPTSSDQMFRALEVQTKLRSRFEHSSGRTMYRSEIRVGVHQVARQSSFGHNHSVITISHGGRKGKWTEVQTLWISTKIAVNVNAVLKRSMLLKTHPEGADTRSTNLSYQTRDYMMGSIPVPKSATFDRTKKYELILQMESNYSLADGQNRDQDRRGRNDHI